MSIPESIVERLAGSPVLGQRRYAGGDISGASEISLSDGRVVVGKQGPVVAAEGRMLRAMARSKAPVPRVIGWEQDVLLIDHVPSSGSLGGEAWTDLAQAIRALQELRADSYGWDEDYALRNVAVENARSTDWAEFWAERRLLCHVPYLDAALAGRLEALAVKLPDLIPASPDPVLVHGDLWGGNVLVDGARISGLIDPCACFGHREVDAATLTVFDSPPPRFFEALELSQGWRERQPVYRLWTWLLHVRLFGDGYRPAVERELDTLGF